MVQTTHCYQLQNSLFGDNTPERPSVLRLAGSIGPGNPCMAIIVLERTKDK